MEHSCRAPGCSHGIVGPPDYEKLNAVVSMPGVMGAGGWVLDGPDGPEFYCTDHRGSASKRAAELGQLPEQKDKPPAMASEAFASMTSEEELQKAAAEALEEMKNGGALPPGSIVPVDNTSIIQAPVARIEAQAEVVVVCQKGRVLGVFTDQEKAGGIRRMAESLSDEPVYCQHWVLDTPGAQAMAEPEPPVDDFKVQFEPPKREKKNGKGKVRRTKKVEPVQQESPEEG